MDQRMQRGDPNRVEHLGRARSGFSSSRVWWVCFAGSVAIHFLAVAIYPFFGNTVNIDAISFSFPNVSGRTEGIQVLRLVEVLTRLLQNVRMTQKRLRTLMTQNLL